MVKTDSTPRELVGLAISLLQLSLQLSRKRYVADTKQNVPPHYTIHTDMPVQDRPELIYIYLPDLDEVGHRHGPESRQLNDTLKQMDEFAGALHQSLITRNLSEIVDLIYVSDHGMSTTSNSRIIYLDEILGKKTFEQIFSQDGWFFLLTRFNIRPDLVSE